MKPASLLVFLVAAAVAACQDNPAAPDYGPAIGNAASFGLWSPGANDDCTKAQHDAFTNNLHELVYHIRCTDGTEMHITMLAAIGTPGQFERSCDGTTVVVGPATPPNSPDGGGVRIIPDRTCVDRDILVPAGQFSNFGALHESWQTSNSVRREDGHTLAFFNPYFQVSLPSRFYDPALAGITGRPIDV